MAASDPVALSPDLLDRPLDVLGAEARTLRELSGAGPVLLVFLRHTG